MDQIKVGTGGIRQDYIQVGDRKKYAGYQFVG